MKSLSKAFRKTKSSSNKDLVVIRVVVNQGDDIDQKVDMAEKTAKSYREKGRNVAVLADVIN